MGLGHGDEGVAIYLLGSHRMFVELAGSLALLVWWRGSHCCCDLNKPSDDLGLAVTSKGDSSRWYCWKWAGQSLVVQD